MSNDKYVALDVHQASIVAHVHDADDRCLTQAIFETRAEAISDFIRGLSGTLRVVFEEGTHSTWLYDLIKPLVAEVTVCDPRHNRLITSGSKGDQVDAHKLAHLLRLGAVRGVYKGAAGLRALKELAHSYDAVVSDLTRVKNRLKALYRGRGIACPGRAVYHLGQREVWLGRLSEPGARRRAEVLYQQLDQLRRLHREAKRALLEESRKHAATGVLRGVPGLGPVRAAQVLSEVGTPHRFGTKRQLRALLRAGGGQAGERRVSVGGRGSAEAGQARRDAGAEPGLQPSAEAGLQECGRVGAPA